MNKKLSDLLSNLKYTLIEGNTDILINDIKYDSRKVEENDIFIAIEGFNTDGHEYIPEAISRGAKVIIVSKLVKIHGDVTIIKVEDTREFLGSLSLAYFEHPEKSLTLIGVTGTTGKTTTTYLIKSIIEEAGVNVGLIGSIGIKYLDKNITTKNTTPEIYDIAKYLNIMLNNNITHVIIEVSSQAYKLNRLKGIKFDLGILTNITKDHISKNEHSSMEEYIECKNKLFLNSKEVIVNNDSKYLKEVLKNVNVKINSYSIDNASDLKVEEYKLVNDEDLFGSIFKTNGIINEEFKINLPGKFNIYNTLAAIFASYKLNISLDIIKRAIIKTKVKGRMELVSVSPKYKVIIDYAHTEDGLKNLVETLKDYKPNKLISVFGGGGNRSRDRRKSLGEIIGVFSDLCIITMDNPRFEELSVINEDIKLGLNKVNAKYIEIDDRKMAINYACNYADSKDIVVLIGKGHEEYQDIKGVKYPFREIDVLKEIERKY